MVRSSGAGPWLRLLLRMLTYSNTCWSSEADSERGWVAGLAAAAVNCGAVAVVETCGDALVKGLCVYGCGCLCGGGAWFGGGPAAEAMAALTPGRIPLTAGSMTWILLLDSTILAEL